MHGEKFLPTLTRLFRDPVFFTEQLGGIRLRSYQTEVINLVCQSALYGLGRSFAVMFPRQSGKNELQAHIEAYLLFTLSQQPAEIVKISPTWKPQSLNAMRRLERVLSNSLLIADLPWQKESGYIYRVGQARIYFFSGEPEAHIVGATASTLLEVDEAQDVMIAKYDKEIAPMAASTNATRVFWGTAWTSQTLLARELRASRQAQLTDSKDRAFVRTADEVAAEAPAYGRYVAEQVARLGRQNPMVRTQYFSEEIDAEAGMFPAARQALMRGSHPPQLVPAGQGVYAFLIDVAGEDEFAQPLGGETVELANPRRDSTALTVVEVDTRSLDDPVLRAPVYRVAQRQLWTGQKQSALYARIKGLADLWRPRWMAVDATGVGAGLSSFLQSAFPGRVLPFTFTAASKSKLGWDFLALCDSGRFKDYLSAEEGGVDLRAQAGLSALFFRQLSACQSEALAGPAHTLRWSVPDGTRDAASGELLHDDLVVSAALSTLLDEQRWSAPGSALILPARDPLAEMDRGF